MNCNGILNVTCNKCGMNQQISCSDFTDWNDVAEDEGAAGKEIQNESIIEHTCFVCKNKIQIKASVWTYPNVPNQKPDCFEIDSVIGGEFVNHNCKCS